MPISAVDQPARTAPDSRENADPGAVARIAGRLAEVRGRIERAGGRGGHGQDVRIVAVTKTHGPETVRAAVAAGISDLGENRVQEAIGKITESGVDARWHLVGHLQRNKIHQATRFDLIQSLDSVRLAEALDREGERRGKPIDVLLQVNASGEAAKGGFSPSTLSAEVEPLVGLRGLRVKGVMTIAAIDASEAILRATFARAREARDALASAGHPATELSMGMSQDYEIAVEEGATMVRLGTILFGERSGP